MIKIGTNKWEAIDWVQDHLGPVTPRNVAEDTYTALITEGLIESSVGEVILVEEVDQDGLRRRARNTMITKDHRKIRRVPRAPQRVNQTVHHHDHMREHAKNDHARHKHADQSYVQATDDDNLGVISYDNFNPKKKR